jgi:hypothetical protein
MKKLQLLGENIEADQLKHCNYMLAILQVASEWS